MVLVHEISEAHTVSYYKGHRGEVLALDVLHATGGSSSSSACLLASGGEDGTVRVWDVATGRAMLCFTGMFEAGEEVVAVAFVDASRLLAATSRSVYELDLKAQGVVIKECAGSLPSLAQDDINQLAAHPRKGSNFLAVADDSGCVTLLDTTTTPPRPYRTLRRPPVSATARGGGGGGGEGQGDDLCTCVAFRPRVQWDVACGFHSSCTVCLWDFSRGRGGCKVIDVSLETPHEEEEEKDDEEEEEEDPSVAPAATSSCQLFNPPYVNALSFSSDGRFLAVAKGNGEVSVYEYARAVEVAVLRGGHTTGVANVCFLDVGTVRGKKEKKRREEGEGEGGEEKFFLVSVGNDRVLCLWDCTLSSGSSSSSGRTSRKDKPRLLKQLTDLPGKPNWMVCTTTVEEKEEKERKEVIKVFVAMTTAEIAVFSLDVNVQEEATEGSVR